MPNQVHVEGGKGLEFTALFVTSSQRSFLNNQLIILHASELAGIIHPFSVPVHVASGNPVPVKGQMDIPCRIGIT